MFYGRGETFAEKFVNNFLDSLEESFSEKQNEPIDKNKITVDLPGYKKTDISLEFKDKILTMVAKNDKRGTISKQWFVERNYTTDPVFNAKFEDCILTIEIPPATSSKKTKIDIL